MHWVDHYWLIMPQMNPEANTYTLTGGGILIDICCTVGVIGIYIALFCLGNAESSIDSAEGSSIRRSIEP